MISARVGLKVTALSGRLPLHWQEHSSPLSQWIQHTDFILYYSIYTPVLPQSTSALAAQPCGYTVSPLQHGATHRVWPSVDPWVASLPLTTFLLEQMGNSYWSWWGQGALGSTPQHPLPCHPHDAASSAAGYLCSGRQPRGLRWAHGGKTLPWPPNAESDCSKEIYSNTLLTESNPPAIFGRLTS